MTVHARHKFIRASNGDLLTKDFTVLEFNALRDFIRWENDLNEMITYPFFGWECLTGCGEVIKRIAVDKVSDETPTPLKAKKPRKKTPPKTDKT